MKPSNIILLSIIACIGGFVFFYVCKKSYESKVSELERKAQDAFVKALNQELKNRNLEGQLSFYFDVKTTASNIPDSVSLEYNSRKYWFRLKKEKHEKNITDNSSARFLHSIAFLENPLLADSLNYIWKKHLLESDISSQPALCVSVTDQNGKVNSKYTSPSEWYKSANLILTIYIGYGCEIEIMGYLKYSIWQLIYPGIIFYSLLYIICVYGVYRISISIRTKILSARQKETIVKIVKETTDTPIRSYILQEHIIFYAEQQKIEINGVELNIQPQTCVLLELFLKAKEKEYVLENNTILESLWPDGSGTSERVHKAINRLRAVLKPDTSIDIKRGNGWYQLII